MEEKSNRPSLDDLSKAPVEVPPLDDGSGKKEEQLLAHERDKFKSELGFIGKVFGGRSEKPGNISALVLLFSFVF